MPKDLSDRTLIFLERWVYYSLLAFLAALTFSNALVEILFVSSFAGWLILKIRRPVPLDLEKKMFWALAVFVFLSAVSFFWSEFPKQSFRGMLKVFKQFLIFWMVADVMAVPERQQTAFRFLTFIIVILGVDGLWQYFLGRDFIRHIPFEMASSGRRVSASFHNYGLLASFILCYFPLLISPLKVKPKGLSSSFQVAGILLGLLLLFWTRSRGAWIAFWGGLVFLSWMIRNKIFLLALVALPLITVLLLPKRMVIHLDIEGKEQSLVERFYLWDRALQVIRARPLTGTGINTYAVAHQKYDRRQNWRVRNYYAHNGYLQIAAETGLPSLFCLLAFFFFYFKNAFCYLRSHPQEIRQRPLIGILTGMVNFLILGWVDTLFHNPQGILAFWFLAGWGIAHQRSHFKI